MVLLRIAKGTKLLLIAASDNERASILSMGASARLKARWYCSAIEVYQHVTYSFQDS